MSDREMNVFVNINQILCSEYILSLLICSASNSWDIAESFLYFFYYAMDKIIYTQI